MAAFVPSIDLAPFLGGDLADRAAVAAQFDDACCRVGFVQVVGHGVSPDVIAAMLAQVDAFFALPLAQKLALVPEHPGINRGYAPRGTEALAYSLGVASAPDLFEAFNIGPDLVADDAWHRAAPHHFFAPNLWPSALPAFRAAFTAYFDAAASLALSLTELFALALGLEANWFRKYVDRSTLTMRVNHYERAVGEAEPVPGQMRMGAHTDYGVVTVLHADSVAGLQVMDATGVFRGVLPEPGALLVNLGDMTAQWTNDRWRSTLHRVVPPPTAAGPARRRSIALFCDANYDARIECVPTCQGPDNPPRYPAVLAGEHLIAKISGPAHGFTLRRTAHRQVAHARLS